MTAPHASALERFEAGKPVELVVESAEEGWRLDVFLTYRLQQYSRAHLRRVITAGGVQVDDHGGKPSYRLKAGQKVRLVLPEIPRQSPKPEPIPIEVVYEDDWLAVVNKPPGMVVHPARGHWSGTLAGAVQYRFGGRLSKLGGPTRPGIVHRLDRDTSGAVLIAKHDRAHTGLAQQFADRSIRKEYFAIVCGIPDRDSDLIDEPIGIHPKQREKMAIRRNHPDARPAQTIYHVVERFDGFAAVRVCPKTGRTHQIRLHLAHIGCPILCDKLYGGRAEITLGELQGRERDDRIVLARQALHAYRLTLQHPQDGREFHVEAPLWPDLKETLNALRSLRSLR
ncbi:RluA family pseudouridine synthase [Thermostilla marina]